MSADLSTLRTLPHAAATLIAQPGKWTQGTEYDGTTGAMCLTGALIRACSTPGDGHIAREVYRHWGRGEGWNDADGRTQAEVVEVLHREITADDLAGTFGPQWEAIVALVRRAAVLTDDEGARLGAAGGAARYAARGAAWVAAWVAARDAAWGAARDATWGAALGAAWDAARDAARGAAWDAAWGAAWALVARDLIGQHGFTQEHYDLLTRPWASVIGPVHPDDKTVQR